MTKDEFIEKVITVLREEFDDASIDRIEDADAIGLDVGGDTWFLTITQD